MLIRISGVRVIEPEKYNAVKDILIDNNKIAQIEEHDPSSSNTAIINGQKVQIDKIIDASSMIAVPGLIDMHVHLREPGHEYKETIKSGCMAAAYGGFTSICAMPNTYPVNDNAQITHFIKKQAADAGFAKVYPIAAISKGLLGKTICEYGELKEAGVLALSDDGMPVVNSQLMRRAFEYAKAFNLLIISHCEEISLVANGSMNEGVVATKMGLAGIPNAAESIMVSRDIALSELTQYPVHIAHVSTFESIQIIRDAKKRGVRVTAETAPHYFTLTDNAVKEYNTNAKMNPPLRTEKDRQAVLEGVADGTIDVIATDHAPHSLLEKDVEFSLGANGIIGLETSLSLSLKLVIDKVITMEELVKKMSCNPAKILGLKNGIEVGNNADITIIDPEIIYIVDSSKFHSLSRNTPFEGMKLKGKAVMTMVDGQIVFENYSA